MRSLTLDLIALPRILAQRLEIADKVPACVVDLTELRRVLNECVAECDAPVTSGEE